MLVNTIGTAQELQEEFKLYDRDYYSYEGYEAILNFYEDLGSNTELDVIAICCDFNEATKEEILSDYCIEDSEFDRYMNDNTWIQDLDNGFYLYMAF